MDTGPFTKILSVNNRKIPKKITKKFVNKVINRQYFHRKTGL